MALTGAHAVGDHGSVSDDNLRDLAIAAQAAALAGKLDTTVASSTYARTGGRNPSITNPLLGGTELLIGGNIVPTPAQCSPAPHYPGWAEMWAGIVNGDGTLDWVTDQIDALRGPDTRGNAVRIIGCAGGIRQGFYTRAQYISAWQTVSDYCRSVGVIIYAALSSGWHDFGVGCDAPPLFPTAADDDDITAVAVALSRMGNIVGFDVVQEYRANLPGTSTILDAQAVLIPIFAAIRAAGVSLPLTASNPVFNASNWVDYNVNTESAFVDFIDRHVYYPAGTQPIATDISQMYSLIDTRIPVLIGEVGIAASASGADRTAAFNAVSTLLKGGRVVGAFAWAIGDQDTVTTNEYGLYSGAPGGALTARTDVTVPFLAWPRRKKATALSKYASVDQAIAPSGVRDILLGTTVFDFGGLNFGASGIMAKIPVGMGGLYRVTLSVALIGGAAAANVDVNLYNAATVSVLEMNPGRAIGIAETPILTGSIILDLPDGTTLRPTIYATTAVTVVGSAVKTFLTLERIPAAAY